MSINFTIEVTDSLSRSGVISTPHGDVPTPNFIPVATQGTVKSLSPDEMTSLGVHLIIANTYHLYLRPGIELIQNFGGLHKFMDWQRSISTDSGGFQIYSLSGMRRITNEGVEFTSHVDGKRHFLTPESVVKFQEALGADIMMPLDQCLPYGESATNTKVAMMNTHSWLKRSTKVHAPDKGALFGIIQGGMYPNLRRESAKWITSLDMPGYGIGGLGIGEPKEQMWEMALEVIRQLPQHKPRHLLGVGSPEDLVEAVSNGIDILDCSLPTRIARNGGLYTPYGRIDVTGAKFKQADNPIQEDCKCYTCNRFSMAYLHHLFRAKELLAYRLSTIHNLHFILRLMENMRGAIKKGEMKQFRQEFHAQYIPASEKTRIEQTRRRIESRKHNIA